MQHSAIQLVENGIERHYNMISMYLFYTNSWKQVKQVLFVYKYMRTICIQSADDRWHPHKNKHKTRILIVCHANKIRVYEFNQQCYLCLCVKCLQWIVRMWLCCFSHWPYYYILLYLVWALNRIYWYHWPDTVLVLAWKFFLFECAPSFDSIKIPSMLGPPKPSFWILLVCWIFDI